MAIQSDSPPGSNDNTTKNSASQTTTDNLKESKADPPREESPPSVFVNSEPIREDQVQNAVKFLSHPKVRGSPVMHRRSFLERKGLTKEEIDEAFHRVPDPTPSATPSQPVTTNQGPTQALQPVPSASSGASSKARKFSGFHWSQAILAVGLVGASGAGTVVLFKKRIIPRFKSWIRKVVLEEEEEEGIRAFMMKSTEKAIATADTAAAAAADFARTSQEVLISQREERQCFQELLQEMRSMSRALLKLEGQTSTIERMMAVGGQDGQRVTNLMQSYAYGKADNGIISGVPGISSAPATSVQPSAASQPKSYMEIMSMVQRGERPSNIREINDQPPNPNQPIPNPRIPPRPKPWEVPQRESSQSNGLHYQENGYGSDSRFQGNLFTGEEGSTAPWWQKNGMAIETENGGGSAVPVERPVQQRAWVPPQPPPIAMAEAAAAIRQQKKSTIQREQAMNNDEAAAPPPQSLGITGELQKITQFSESGGGSGIEANLVGGENPAAPHYTTEIENGESNNLETET